MHQWREGSLFQQVYVQLHGDNYIELLDIGLEYFICMSTGS